VLLAGYEEWGLGVLERVRGTFGVAIAEPSAGRVVIARDRVGEKPLVYMEDDLGVVGASELPALLASGRDPGDVDPRALSYFLSRNLRHVPEPLSIFRRVRKLPPGHAMVVEHGRIAQLFRWWHPSWRGRSSPQELACCIREAVAMQREADVEVGTLLSGGIDSSIVTGLASANGRKLRTYALGRDTRDPELARARAAAHRFGTCHHEATFRPDQLERLDALIRQLGEPVALMPLTHADVLMERVHEDGLKVVLTGNGADELLCGYDGAMRLRVASTAMRVLERLPDGLLRSIVRLPLPPSLRELVGLAAIPLQERKTEIYRRDIAERTELLAAELREEARMPPRCPVFAPWTEAFDGRRYLDLSQFLTLVVEDAHSVTISADLVGMRHSVESRAPFLDPLVMEAAFRLAPRWRIGGLRRPHGKRALRRQFASLIGGRAANANKMGFGYAIQERELIRGPLRGAIEARIRDGEGIARYFDHNVVVQVLEDHMEGRRDAAKLLLSLYAFETWHRFFGTAAARVRQASP
jgi:asparagine synthase (glutamine-hydrolysing)